MTTQIRNESMIELERADFFGRNEPNASWSNTVSNHLLLPGLRGFWPTSAHHVTVQGSYVDDIACGYDVGMFGSPTLQLWNLALPPCCYFDGESNLALGSDDIQFDVLGTAAAEPMILAAQRGLTVGAWVRFSALGAIAGIIDKWTIAGNLRAYRLYKTAANTIVFEVSTDGTAVVSITSTTTIAANVWYWVMGRFSPSTALDVYVNSVRTTNVAGIPVSIYNTTAVLSMGQTNASYLNGYMSLIWLAASRCWDGAAATRDVIPFSLFEHSKRMFNVG
jgi:hypothetical protein